MQSTPSHGDPKPETLDVVHSNEQSEKAIPAWLKMVEEQSYQAELLISGLVVAGLFQLPDMLVRLVESLIIESDEIGYHFLWVAGNLIFMLSQVLLIAFVIHFLLRSIWVALLGLNSAYPEGVNKHSTFGGGTLYWRKASEKFSNLSAYNLVLDRQCSTIFSSACGISVINAALSALIILVYWIFDWLMGYFPILADYLIYIGIGLYVLFITLSFSIQLLARWYPDNKRIEKLLEGFTDASNGLLTFYIFRRPVGYMTNILGSHAHSWTFIIMVIVGSFMLGLFSSSQTADRPILKVFDPERYITFNEDDNLLRAYNYDNLRDPEMLIFTPVIESDVVKGNVLKLFIPIIEREKTQAKIETLSFWEKLNTSRASRDSIWDENIARYADFHTIYMNDSLYDAPKYHHHIHTNARESGLLFYLPATTFRPGDNVLEIRKDYFWNDNQKIIRIPFYFGG